MSGDLNLLFALASIDCFNGKNKVIDWHELASSHSVYPIMNAQTEIQDTQSSINFLGLLTTFCASALVILSLAAVTAWLQGPTGTILDVFPTFIYLVGVPLVALLGVVFSRDGSFEVGLATMAGVAISNFILMVNVLIPALVLIPIMIQIPGVIAGVMIGGALRKACREKTSGLKPDSFERLRAIVLLGGAVIALTAIVLAGIHSTEILEGLFPPDPKK
jgi:hypothetical protein